MVGLGQKGVARVDGGGGCLKYLKRGWNKKEGKENKDFKKGGQAGPKGKARTSLRTMRYISFCKFSFICCYHKK